jgi:ABC-2 type transport system ATP-binding protein
VTSNAPVVTARDLRYAYPSRTALDGVSFAVPEGSLFGFLGPNGGGKTTLFRILATLLPPAGGEVRIAGAELPAEAARARRALGVVFQSPSLDLRLTVEENLRHQGHLYGLSGKDLAGRIDDGLARLGVTDRRSERAEALSGGLRRRAEIAKALLHRPRVLLLDEPSTGLDPGARRELWRTLDELRGDEDGDEGSMTVLLTTHFIEEAGRCDRLVLLDRGRIVTEGAPAELEAEIGGDVVTVTPTLTSATRSGETAARALAAEVAERFPELADRIDAAQTDTVRFESEEAHRMIPRIAEAFPGRIGSITVSRPTLEDVFLKHTGRGLYAGEAAEPAAAEAAG